MCSAIPVQNTDQNYTQRSKGHNLKKLKEDLTALPTPSSKQHSTAQHSTAQHIQFKMRQVMLSLASICFFLLLSFPHSSNASLLSMVDRPGSLLADFWSDHFPDPFRVLEQIPFGIEKDESVALSPARVDWKETPEGHVIMLDVPGLSKDDLKIEVLENRVLRVSGERKREEEKKGDHWHRVERSYGKFWRQFKLPDNVDLDSVKAKLENGVLNLSFSKLSPDKIKGPRIVSIAAEEGKPETAKLKSEAKQEL